MSAAKIALTLVLGLVGAAACAHAQNASDTAAEVNGTRITIAEVDEKLGRELATLQEEMFALRQKQLDALIDQTLLAQEAARRRLTVAALVDAEITSRVAPVTADDVETFYEANKARLNEGGADLKHQIRTFLAAQRTQARHREFLAGLRTSATVETFLTPPPAFRSEVSIAGAPSRGPADAPVTIVEFSDFHCPFCRTAVPVLDQVLDTYGDKVRLVYREFPIDGLHPQARAVSQAAACAHEQGKFWPFHDVVFANAPDASPATLARFAKEAGLDVSAFETCRASGRHAGTVRASNEEGARLGITGTPTFFINGRLLVGAQPFDEFARIIDEELALAGSARPAPPR